MFILLGNIYNNNNLTESLVYIYTYWTHIRVWMKHNSNRQPQLNGILDTAEKKKKWNVGGKKTQSVPW